MTAAPGPTLRRATAADTAAVARLHAESWRRNYRGAYADEYLDGDLVADRLGVWGGRLGAPSPSTWTAVADEGDRVVGFVHVVLGADQEWGALVDNLHVAHDRQRAGVGRALMAAAGAAVRAADPASALHLWVLEQNQRGQAFYAALGGTRVERALVTLPGRDARLLVGTPAKYRYVWPDPSALCGGESSELV